MSAQLKFQDQVHMEIGEAYVRARKEIFFTEHRYDGHKIKLTCSDLKLLLYLQKNPLADKNCILQNTGISGGHFSCVTGKLKRIGLVKSRRKEYGRTYVYSLTTSAQLYLGRRLGDLAKRQRALLPDDVPSAFPPEPSP